MILHVVKSKGAYRGVTPESNLLSCAEKGH
jgi:hypothetical protein